MEELLKPIKSTSFKSDLLITPISSSSTKQQQQQQQQHLRISAPQDEERTEAAAATTSTDNGGEIALKSIDDTDTALALLKSSPSLPQLSAILHYLTSSFSSSDKTSTNVFDVRNPSPLSSRIVNSLITDTLPNFWRILSGTTYKFERSQLLSCLRSVTGLGGIVARIRVLTSLASTESTAGKQRDESREQLADAIDVLERLLRGGKAGFEIWEHIFSSTENDATRTKIKNEMAWKEFVNLVAGGRLLSIASEADLFLLKNVEGYGEEGKWIGDGRRYSAWLGRNIANMMRYLRLDDENVTNGERTFESNGWKELGMLVSKALSLGYSEETIDARILVYFPEDGVVSDEKFFRRIRKMLDTLQPYDRRAYLNSVLRLLSKRHFASHSSIPLSSDQEEDEVVSAVAGVIYALLTSDNTSEPDEYLLEIITEWITSNGGAGSGEPVSIRRAIISAISKSSHGIVLLQEALEKNVSTFGDKMWIRHAPVIHQEVNAQSLLLLAGYVNRSPPSYLKLLSKSSTYLNAISNRLEATSTRVRFLGMVVGEAVSELVDGEKVRMKFSGIEEMEGEEAEKWKRLAHIKDEVGDYKLLAKERKPRKKKQTTAKQAAAPSKALVIEEIGDGKETAPATEMTGPRITEVVDSEDDNEDDLIPYPKIDSDPEDSDDDPTLVNRKKESPPVYIRDLLYMLNSHDSYDRQKLALEHAAVLIRRKANFGNELTSHLNELLESLIGLQDKFNMDDFETMRLKAVVALVVSQPVPAGKWIAQRVFDGEWSLNQRCLILSAIGICALEVSGASEADPSWVGKFELTKAEKDKAKFPSKKLPSRLHDVYSYSSTPVDTLAADLESSMVRPMAIDAADKLSGPEVLKVRKFSSRMDVEAKRKKPTPNKLGKVVAEAFFIPLMNAWSLYLQDYGESTSHVNPHLLALYLKTLTILLHNAGPNIIYLPQLTSSFWDLLLSLRHNSLAISSSTVLDSILLGFLTLVDVNSTTDEAKRRLAQDHSKELVETQEWVSAVFEGRGGKGGEGNDEKRQALAAAILVKTREVVEKYERLLIGELIG